jgi:hypothetical protein
MCSLYWLRQPSRARSTRHVALLLALLASLLASTPRTHAATVIYVNTAALGANNGTSWSNAFTSLQAAIAVAVGGNEVWVAAGRYTPSSSGDRNASFVLKSGVKFYGGFAGTENDLSARDIAAHATILSGDLLGDDGPNFTNNSENSYHVVRSANNGSSTILDGFTVSGGNANGTGAADRGAGMFNENSAVTVRHVTVSGNTASNAGGGVFNSGNIPALIDMTINNNFAPNGGGMYNQGGTPTLTRVTVRGNRATTGGGVINQGSDPILTDVWLTDNEAVANGGGIYNGGGGSPKLTNLTISGNRAGFGGGMYNATSNPLIVNTVLSGNRASRGGAIENAGTSQPVLTNVTISGNLADTAGGAIISFGTSVVAVRNSILWNNDAAASPEIGNADSSTTSVTNSIVKGGYPSGTSIIDADPLFLAPVTTIPSSEGNLHLRTGSPAIDKGDISFLPAGVTTDRAGLPRVVGDAVDLGAYEWPLTIYMPRIER